MNRLIVLFILLFNQAALGFGGIGTSYLRLEPSTLPTVCRLGDLRADTSTSQVELCNGSNTWIPFAQTTATQTLTNKTISGSSNTITNVSLTSGVTGVLPLVNGGTGTAAASANAAFNSLSPMTTGGDMIAAGSSGVAVRVANGNAGQVWTSAGGTATPGWSGVPTPAVNYTPQTSNYNAVINDWVFCSGSSFAVTLPTAVGLSGKNIVIQHNGTSLSQVYQINTTSSQTINGPGGTVSSGNYSLYTNGEILIVTSDGSNWQVVEHKTVSAAASYTPNLGHTFTISSATVSANWVYSNSSQTFTVTSPITSGTVLQTTGTGTPAASGTLTCVSGGCSGNLTFSSTAAALGVATSPSYTWRREGRFMVIEGVVTPGTVTANFQQYSLPAGAILDTTVIYNSSSTITSACYLVGDMIVTGNSGAVNLDTLVMCGGSSTSTIWSGGPISGVASQLIPYSANAGLTAANQVAIRARFPVSGWQP